jgi:hypothetical protein
MLVIPPGLDVVCFSNGSDYVRGLSYAIKQVNNGRIVMSVDSTDLLNRRHLDVKDDHWLTPYPNLATCTELSFDEIGVYSGDWSTKSKCVGIEYNSYNKYISSISQNSGKRVVIVTYGNGLPYALQAMNAVLATGTMTPSQICVVDSPYLSDVPQQLRDLLSHKSIQDNDTSVIFADVCKEGAGMPLAGFAVKLQNLGILPKSWKVIGACPTYNPLGQLVTFLSAEDIKTAVFDMLNKK